MPYISALFHLVWSTMFRKPILNKETRTKLFAHIKDNTKTKGIYLDCINGHYDHVHCVVSLSADQTVSNVIQLIKGENSWWFNKEKLCKEKLEWQDEYFAVSISYSDLARVREYIYNQESHHQKKTFQREYDELMKEYGLKERTGSNE